MKESSLIAVSYVVHFLYVVSYHKESLRVALMKKM